MKSGVAIRDLEGLEVGYQAMNDKLTMLHAHAHAHGRTRLELRKTLGNFFGAGRDGYGMVYSRKFSMETPPTFFPHEK